MSLEDLNNQLDSIVRKYPSLSVHNNVSKANKRVFAIDIDKDLRVHIFLLWPGNDRGPVFQRMTIAGMAEGVREHVYFAT